MRPYTKTTDHPAFIADSHHRARYYRYRRSHRIPRDQTLRREQRSAARAEEREIARAERAAYREELRAEESEQAAANVSYYETEADYEWILTEETWDAPPPYWEEESEAIDKLSDDLWWEHEAEEDRACQEW